MFAKLLNPLDSIGTYEPIVPPAAPTVESIKIRSINLPNIDDSMFLNPNPVKLELSLSELRLYL